jgi:hypothetical protein
MGAGFHTAWVIRDRGEAAASPAIAAYALKAKPKSGKDGSGNILTPKPKISCQRARASARLLSSSGQ